MNLLSLLTLVAAALIVAALAIYLITVIVLLRKTLRTLGTVNVGLRAIAQRVEPLEPILSDVNADLTAVRDGLVAVLDKKGAKV